MLGLNLLVCQREAVDLSGSLKLSGSWKGMEAASRSASEFNGRPSGRQAKLNLLGGRLLHKGRAELASLQAEHRRGLGDGGHRVDGAKEGDTPLGGGSEDHGGALKGGGEEKGNCGILKGESRLGIEDIEVQWDLGRKDCGSR